MPLISDTYLRRAERDDLDTVVAWMEEPDFQYFLYGDPARAPRQIREQIAGMLGRSAGHTMPGSIYLIVDTREQGALGMLSLQNISWRNRACTLDLYIGPEQHRNRLTAAAAAYRALEYCFDELNLHRVGSYIYAFNRASWRILEKTGAKRELVLPKHVARDGVLHDVYGYGLLRSEFDAMRARDGKTLSGLSLDAMIQRLAADVSEDSVS